MNRTALLGILACLPLAGRALAADDPVMNDEAITALLSRNPYLWGYAVVEEYCRSVGSINAAAALSPEKAVAATYTILSA